MAKSKRPLTERDFPVPMRGNLSDLQYSMIDVLRLKSAEWDLFSQFLDELIDAVTNYKERNRNAPSASADRKSLKGALDAVRKARGHLKRCGPIAMMMSQTDFGSLGHVVSTGWLRETFPDDPAIPMPYSPRRGRTPIRSPQPSGPLYIEQETEQARYYFTKFRGPPTAEKMLIELERALAATLSQPAVERGRKEIFSRRLVLLNLVRFWQQQLRRRDTGSDLGEFCIRVFEFIGWPTEGLDAALAKVLSAA